MQVVNVVKICVRITVLVISVGLHSLCAIANTQEADDPYRLQLRWEHQAQFMGYYVAEALGIYARAGLDVSLMPGGPDIEPVAVLADDQADMIVEWMPSGLAARARGIDSVHVAQIFQQSGLMLVCDNQTGIRRPSDLAGKTVGVWRGTAADLFDDWIASLGMRIGSSSGDVHVVNQGTDAELLTRGAVDCISAMSYNEYWTLLEGGIAPSRLTIFHYADYGFSLLEDGLWVQGDCLLDAACSDRTALFLAAALEGWRYAMDNPEEALEMVLSKMYPDRQATPAERRHQANQVREVIKLLGDNPAEMGLLDVSDYTDTVNLLMQAQMVEESINTLGMNSWTHSVWSNATNEGSRLYSRNTQFVFSNVVASRWFYILEILGVIAFGIAGFLRAYEMRFDVWGALICTSLPAVGGGILRDFLIGRDAFVSFAERGTISLYCIILIVVVGRLVTRHLEKSDTDPQRFKQSLLYTDSFGFTVHAVVGFAVALVAELHWMWIPICSALTCAGGGLLLDMVCSNKPRTFKGHPYEEMAVIQAVVMMGLMYLANLMFMPDTYIVAVTIAALIGGFVMKLWVTKKDIKSPLLGVAVAD